MNALYALELAAIVAIASAATWVGHRIARARPRWGVLTLTLGVGVFLLDFALEYGAECLLALPQPFACTVDLIHALGFISVGAAVRLLPPRRTRRAMLLALIALASIYVARGHVALVVQGHTYAALAGVVQDHHLEQSTGYSCMPASIAVLLDYAGIPAGEGLLAAECRTTLFGTDTFRSARAIERVSARAGRPLACRRRAHLEATELLALPGAAIVSVWVGRVSHAIAVAPTGDGRLFVSDPMRPARVALTLEAFARRYAWQRDALWAVPAE